MKAKILLKNMLTTMVAGILMTSAITAAEANNPPPTIKADAPNRYVVKKGDTLWDISGKYLSSPWRWKEIWATNKQIKNPNLIYPNDILILCIIKGKTLVGVDTGEGCAGIEKQMSGKVSTNTVTVTSTENSIPAIPLSNIRHWLDRVIIVNPNDFTKTPYILASKSGNLVTGQGNKVYAKGVPLTVGQSYGIYREGKPYIDPTTNRIVGLEVTQVASGFVTDVASNGVSSIDLTNSYGGEVHEGDRVMVELDGYIPPVFYPTPAEVNRGGRILRIMDSIAGTAKGGVVAINLGSVDGAKPGDVLNIYKKGALVRDVHNQDTPVRLPSELSGRLMVFKSFDYISYAYILESDSAISVGDQLVAPPYL